MSDPKTSTKPGQKSRASKVLVVVASVATIVALIIAAIEFLGLREPKIWEVTHTTFGEVTIPVEENKPVYIRNVQGDGVRKFDLLFIKEGSELDLTTASCENEEETYEFACFTGLSSQDQSIEYAWHPKGSGQYIIHWRNHDTKGVPTGAERTEFGAVRIRLSKSANAIGRN